MEFEGLWPLPRVPGHGHHAGGQGAHESPQVALHHVAGDAPEETEGDLATAGEFLAAFKNASSADDLLAAFHRFHGNGTNKGSGKGKDGEAGAARLRRCHNFG